MQPVGNQPYANCLLLCLGCFLASAGAAGQAENAYPAETWLKTGEDGKPDFDGWARQLSEDEAASSDREWLSLYTANGQYGKALEVIGRLRGEGRFDFLSYELYLQAMVRSAREANTPESTLNELLAETLAGLDDLEAFRATELVEYDLDLGDSYSAWLIQRAASQDPIPATTAMNLLSRTLDHQVRKTVIQAVQPALQADLKRRYLIDTDAGIRTPDGATLSAVVVRRRADAERRIPTALVFTIYAFNNDMVNLRRAIQSAAHGYAGVVAFSRGKRSSPDAVAPYEHEHADVNATLEWITQRPWSDGRVGMYGGSYNGFSQWAGTKRLHPALKTIVPYVAAIPGLGLPMENNVFLGVQIAWPLYVTNNKTLDDETYHDGGRWRALQQKWFVSGRPFRDLDALDGTPNPWLQKWLNHPAYDEYWQSMVPYQDEYALIDIPVLSVTGYYDDGQISALHYLNEHYRYKPDAKHYLLIGPYDHRGAQGRPPPFLRGYELDEVARIDVAEITFQWLDHVLKGAPRPALLEDRINYQRMGSNRWYHAPSMQVLNGRTRRYFLSTDTRGDFHRLVSEPSGETLFLTQEVDLADRETLHNDYYPAPLIRPLDALEGGLVFASEPFAHDASMNGQFSGILKIRINKRDVDVGVVLYEWLPDDTLFHLSYYLGRASYAHDMSHRKLLTPGQAAAIPIRRTRMVSRSIRAGSRLLAVLDVNKNPFAQVNYGTGKDVSDESIDDAGEPLRIEWSTESFLEIPLIEDVTPRAAD